MWFGTDNGLNRYDGRCIVNYYHTSSDTTSICGNHVWTILEDRSGILWIGTSGGLNRYDRLHDCFIRYEHDPSDSLSISNGSVRVVYQDHAGTLWIGTTNGLNRFDPGTGRFKRYRYKASDPQDMSDNYILSIYEDHHHRLWVGTGAGLHLFNFEGDSLPFYHWHGSNKFYIHTITAIHQDLTGKIRIGGFSGGLKYLDADQHTCKQDSIHHPSTGIYVIHEDRFSHMWIARPDGLFHETGNPRTVERFVCDPANPHSLSSSSVRAMLETSDGLLWLGTTLGGVSYCNLRAGPFQNILIPFPEAEFSVNHRVTALIQAPDSSYFIGTYGQGIHRWFRNAGSDSLYMISSCHKISDEVHRALHFNTENHLWIACEFSRTGLYRLDIINGDVQPYQHRSDNEQSLGGNSVLKILPEKSGLFWLAIDRGGLNRFNPETGRAERFMYNPDNPHGISTNRVVDLAYDHNGNLWVATTGSGLSRRNTQTNKFDHFRHDTDNPNSLGSDLIQAIRMAPDSSLWLATGDAGLNRFDIKSKTVTRYTIEHGLASQKILALECDDRGMIWCSTPRGISCLNPETGQVRNYDTSDGLLDGNYFDGASYKNRQGELLFGGYGGFTIFHPDSIHPCNIVPPAVITGFRVRGKTADLDTVIIEKKHVTLTYRENSLAFDFAALNFMAPHRSRFKYKMETLDHNWIYSGHQQTAVYSRIPPGHYVFRVRAANQDGVWNEQCTSLYITITPPFWRTIPAYIIYLLLFFGALFYWHCTIQNRARVQSELERHKFEAKKLREIHEMKSRFFANISHEFRTPLTLIEGPATTLINKAAASDKKNLCIIRQNARRLLTLVNQLLDLSKLEAGAMGLRAVRLNVAPLVRGLVLSFSAMAEQKNIRFEFYPPDEDFMAWVDQDKFDKIINNLLSNAFKITPEHGEVLIRLSADVENNSHYRITVDDSGSGIPEPLQEKVFDRFYQLNNGTTRTYQGAGIGLALARELADRHHGRITVENRPGCGARFTVLLPLHESSFEKHEIVHESDNPAPREPESVDALLHHEYTTAKTSSFPNGIHLPRVLLVEDNKDVRYFIRMALCDRFDILEAENGFSGINLAIKHIPDLIITDIMMPEMDGYELCRRIKTDIRISHIPVIMLTARAGTKNKISGFETGADAYITKPFNPDVLCARIDNLITQRRNMKNRFCRESSICPKDIAVTSNDEKFLNRLQTVLEKNMSDSSFDVSDLAEHAGMSRQHLTRKLRSVTGYTAREFIRMIRLKRAAQLLDKNAGNVTQIAYESGFENPSYFTECFKNQFGSTPSDYRKKK